MAKEKKVLDWRWTLLIGLIGLTIGGYIMKLRIDFFRTSISVVGMVSEIQEKRSGTKKTYYPVVKFKTETGDEFTTVGDVGRGGSSDYEVGEEINVRYMIANPENAKMSTFQQMWLAPIVALVIGGVCFAAGIYNYQQESKKT